MRATRAERGAELHGIDSLASESAAKAPSAPSVGDPAGEGRPGPFGGGMSALVVQLGREAQPFRPREVPQARQVGHHHLSRVRDDAIAVVIPSDDDGNVVRAPSAHPHRDGGEDSHDHTENSSQGVTHAPILPAGLGGDEGALASTHRLLPQPQESCGGLPAMSATPADDSERLRRLASSYELRAELRPYAVDDRIRKCGSVVYTDPQLITEEYEDGSRSARWSGVVLCNRAGCPVCGAARARRFHDQVLRTLGSGGLWQHVILTVPHTPADSWSDVYERLLAGVRGLSHGQAGRIVMRDVQATIRATETTWSMRSGWHVHLHVLWRVPRPLLDAERRLLATQWAETLGRTPRELEHMRAHGVRWGRLCDCDLGGARREAASYVSKLAHEMSGAHKSAHPEHWTLGELYQRATEDEQFVPLVQEYQRATKGRRLYQLDRRAQRLHDAAPELPERVVVRSWTYPVDRQEYRSLSRRERAGDALALYLPLEVAVRARGDPLDEVEDTVYSLLAARPP